MARRARTRRWRSLACARKRRGRESRSCASHVRWEVRAYAARAAAVLSDTARLRILARDPNDNVKEIAIDALSKLTGHADDELFLEALDGNERAGGARGGHRTQRVAARRRRDGRAGRVRAMGRSRKRLGARRAPRAPRRSWPARERGSAAVRPRELPPRAVALALGEDVRLRVTMAGSTGGGSFVVRLRGDVAPIMAARVLELAHWGYYDATTWHRVEHDFVIQGGGPGANEYIGHPRFFRDELGTVPHARGTVGMSTRGHDTGDAQWFINLKDNLRLGRDYTVFAEVVEGIEVVDGIHRGRHHRGDAGGAAESLLARRRLLVHRCVSSVPPPKSTRHEGHPNDRGPAFTPQVSRRRRRRRRCVARRQSHRAET